MKETPKSWFEKSIVYSIMEIQFVKNSTVNNSAIDSLFFFETEEQRNIATGQKKGLFGQGSQQIVLTLQETCGFFGANERPRNSSDASSEGDAGAFHKLLQFDLPDMRTVSAKRFSGELGRFPRNYSRLGVFVGLEDRDWRCQQKLVHFWYLAR